MNSVCIQYACNPVDMIADCTVTCHSGATATTYYALTDIQGTVHGFADADGNLVARYAYDAWGNLLDADVAVSTLAGNRYLFQGREYSWATGLYNFRARWYDPATGRWLSKDPIGISGGLNLYAFCGNNPVNYVDPWGLEEVESRYKERMRTIAEAEAQFSEIGRFFAKPYFNALRRGVTRMYQDELEGVSPEDAHINATIEGTVQAFVHDAILYSTALPAANAAGRGLGFSQE